MKMDIDSILPIVTSFFKGMTSEQWNLLKSGKPDVDTITILGETLLEIVFLMTQSILKGLKSTAVSEKSVICSLGNTLPQVFALALDFRDEVNLANSEHLTKLTAKEIAECVNSVLSMGVDSVKATIPRVTPPKRLQCMIKQAAKMIRGLMRNLKRMCAPSKSRKKVNPQLVKEDDSHDSCQLSSSSRKTFSVDRKSLPSAQPKPKTLEELIKEVVCDHDRWKSGSTLEIKHFAEDVADVIVDEIMSQNEHDPETAQTTPSLKKMSERIKTCPAKQTAQASICRFVGRLNHKYFDSQYNPAFDEVSSRQSMQSVMSDIDALLPTAVGEIQQGQNGSQWMDDIVSGETLELTNELNNILNNHVDRMKPKVTSRPNASRRQSKCLLVCPPHASISADIRAIVWCFLGVMRWFLHTQSETVTSRDIPHTSEKAVSKGPIGGASLPSAPGKGSGSKSKEYRKEQEVERRKLSIGIIVLKLVSRIFAKATLSNTLRSPNIITNRLVEKIWVEIKDEDFEITPKMMKQLHKVIFKIICKNWHGVVNVLLEMQIEDSLDKYIVSSFKDQLVSHQKRSNPISRCFSLLCTFSS